MVNATDPEVVALERDWPDWLIWTVSTWDGTMRATVFCARRWDGAGGTLSGYSAAELAECLEQAESAR